MSSSQKISASSSHKSPLRSPSGTNQSMRTNTSDLIKDAPPLVLSKDPTALLDSLDHNHSLGIGGIVEGESNSVFDPIEFLNQHYETEASLSQQLPALRDSVRSRMQLLDDRISAALQRQSETAQDTRKNVAVAMTSVVELQNRILLIRDKAAASEQKVLEITKDMKRLDCAKQHLSRTITTLKRLHMLVHAMDQLRSTILLQDRNNEPPNYQTASHLVDAVGQLFQHFDAYTPKVQPMQILSSHFEKYKLHLRQSVSIAFWVMAFGPEQAQILKPARNTIPEESATATALPISVTYEHYANLPIETLKGGILLIESLDFQQLFIHEFCQDQLGDYLKKFEPPNKISGNSTSVNGSSGNGNIKVERRVSSFKKVVVEEPLEADASSSGLDQMEKRYTWFRNGPLAQIQERFPNVFPPRWNLHATLANLFLKLTRDHILALLDGPRKDPASNDATTLLKALQKTILFEKDITAWLERECGAIFETTDGPATTNRATEEASTLVLKPLVGVASVAFESYMGPYIRLEEQSMDEHLAEALEDRTVDTRGERPVFISSTNLFVFIKGSITRCTALTKGNAFYLLYRAFEESLKKYALILNNKLPSPIPNVVGSIAIAAPFGNKEQQNSNATASYRIPVGEEVTVCHVISTCEYCADTMEALEDLIRDTIEEEHKSKIDMISDQEQFHEIIAKSIRVLVTGLTHRLEGSLKMLVSTNWSAVEVVGDESLYVLSIHEEVEPFVCTVRSLLPTSYFRSFCDKFILSFTSSFFDNLIRVKRISEPGTQQLLLDLNNLKTLFLKLPVLEDSVSFVVNGINKKAPSASIAPALYTKTVQKEFGRMESILKLVGMPNELLIENFKAQMPTGSTSDMQIVMNLKGLKRNEQVTLLEKFGYDPISALKGATAGVTSAAIVSERVQQLQDQGSTVAAKVNSDLNQMRQKVDEFRKTFR